MFLHVDDVKTLDGYRLYLRFNNGVEGIVDLQAELHGEVFALSLIHISEPTRPY